MFLFVALIAAVSALPESLDVHPIEDSYSNYRLWLQEYKGLVGDWTPQETAYRYSVWSDEIKEINAHNSAGHLWTKGVNQFSATTWEEFQDSHLMAPQDCSATSGQNRPQLAEHILNMEAPDKIDWRDQKVVGEVKDQGSCGSCWAFSSTGCLESQAALWSTFNNKQLIEFSEQCLMDCSTRFKNKGCSGGLPSQAFEYVYYNKGINSEFTYPYTAKQGTCRYTNATGKSAGVIAAVYNITTYNDKEQTDYVGTIGPVAVCFQVVSGFKSYKSGVYSSTTCKNTTKAVNHAVLATGYGVFTDSAKTPYYIVKNSWNWAWGNQGYFLMQRGKNMCGISACSSFPVINKKMLA